ncbi:hypothetical protein FEM33_24090 [Dyadobacter flavalbus]|uniref:Uncharacterized protein n=1 Tax=Dyadobacter flavalbus TaxID=2579942 RepID=A0A5M8QA32_9BACT|nr:hypothetical protein FEM33_24090 [Dyadobacter flavalbus]
MQPHFSVNTLNELFSTAKGHSFQCDLTSKVILHFGEIQASFRIQDFLNFRRLINAIDIHSRIFDLSDESDYEFVEAPRLNIYHKLTLCELIQLRELVNGTFFAIELNSMLHEILYKDSELV